MPDLNLISSENTTLGGIDAYKIVYTGTLQQVNFKFMQIWSVVDGKMYLITFTSTVSDYSNYLATAEDIINTFELE